VRLCDDTVLVPDDALIGLGARTGSVLSIPPSSIDRTVHDKPEVRGAFEGPTGDALADISAADGGDKYVLLLTDTSARRRTQPRAYFAAGRPYGDEVPVDSDALRRLKLAIADASDLQPSNAPRAGEDSEFADVVWKGRTIGQRRRILKDQPCRPGLPVWVNVSDILEQPRVTAIRLSQIWRAAGSGTVRERVGDAAPCTDVDQLCPSSRVFGSADTEGNIEGEAEQRSYRGHVRFEDAVAVGDQPAGGWRDVWPLAPLASPKPSAGQFYLRQIIPPDAAPKDETPLAQWGSAADKKLRPIRGRKAYWRTVNPDGRISRGKARRHQANNLVRQVHRIRPGLEFRTRVAVDGLTPAELGGLLVALDPCLLVAHAPGLLAKAHVENIVDDQHPLVLALGGGKPFGFGSVRVDVESFTVQTAEARYASAPATGVTADQCVVAFVEGVHHGIPDLASAGVEADVWPSLISALTLGKVADADVWYPPGTGDKGSPEFDRGFAFWKQTSGSTVGHATRGLVPLPPATAADQRLDSRGRADR
jgi:CRISPR-associated protein (TIGR03986 family)